MPKKKPRPEPTHKTSPMIAPPDLGWVAPWDTPSPYASPEALREHVLLCLEIAVNVPREEQRAALAYAHDAVVLDPKV